MIKVNKYFDDTVMSLGFDNQGRKASVGVMAPGTYTFGTGAPEKMTVVRGALKVKRPGRVDWVTYTDGDSFEVPGDSSFDVEVTDSTAYLCDYL